MVKLPIPRFTLRLPKAESTTLISLVLRYNGKRLVYSTGYSIHPDDWDSKIQRPINKTRRNDLFAIRRFLDDLANYCTSIFMEHDYGNISVAEFKKQLDIRTGKKELPKAKQRQNFLEFIDQELQEMKDTGVNSNTISMFKLHLTKLKEKTGSTSSLKKFRYFIRQIESNNHLPDYTIRLTEDNMAVFEAIKTMPSFDDLPSISRRTIEKAKLIVAKAGTGWDFQSITCPVLQ